MEEVTIIAQGCTNTVHETTVELKQQISETKEAAALSNAVSHLREAFNHFHLQ
jgi:hypothetical protein